VAGRLVNRVIAVVPPDRRRLSTGQGLAGIGGRISTNALPSAEIGRKAVALHLPLAVTHRLLRGNGEVECAGCVAGPHRITSSTLASR